MFTSAEEFMQLLASDDPTTNLRAAHEAASEEVWLEVIRDYPEAKKWVIHNKTVPHNILVLLADDEDAEIRWWIASKRKAGSSLLEKLSEDPDEAVRREVALNAKTPLHILEKLTKDESEMVAVLAIERIQTL